MGGNLEARAGVPKRIRLLVYTNDWGGAEVQTVALAEALLDRGHDVTIAELGSSIFTERTRALFPHLRVDPIQLGEPFEKVSAWRWFGLLRALNAEVGVFEKVTPQSGSLRFDLAARFAFQRFLCIEHDVPPPKPSTVRGRHLGGLLPGLGLWWYRYRGSFQVRSLGPHRIVTVSHAIADQLTRIYGYPSSKTIPIPNGIDLLRFGPNPKQRQIARANWGIPEDAIVFGSVGRLLHPVKGFDLAIELFARLCRAYPQLPLWYVLVGDGRDRALLQAQAAASGAPQRIVFPGYTPSPWETYPGMDFVLIPSIYEGLSLALLEAMASGCCPIATAVGGKVEILSKPQCGWLVPENDPDAFYHAMEAAVRMSALSRSRMGEQARQHVVHHYNAADQWRRIAALIEEPLE